MREHQSTKFSGTVMPRSLPLADTKGQRFAMSVYVSAVSAVSAVTGAARSWTSFTWTCQCLRAHLQGALMCPDVRQAKPSPMDDIDVG